MHALLILVSLSAAAAWRFSRCPEQCACNMALAPEFGSQLRTVDCSSRRLHNFPAPEHIPSDAQALRLSGNRIRRLHPDLRLWLPDLLILDLSANRITSLPHPSKGGLGFFEGLTALRRLNLASNSLRRISSDAFTGLLALQELDLSANRLDGIMDDAFEGLGKLETLRLGGNRLSYVQKSWWEQIQGLISLDLNRNELSLLQADAFTGLFQLRSLDISGNKLFRLNEHAFFGLRRLATLSIAANLLPTFPQAALKQLRPSLKSLDLSRNPIFRLSTDDIANFPLLTDVKLSSLGRLRLVERGALKNLPSLLILELHDCPYLAYLDTTAFVNTPALSHLFLQNNNLTVLQPQTIQALPALEELSFYGNPLACDCNSRWLKEHLTSSSIVFQEADRLVCASPDQHKFKRFAMLKEKELPHHCSPRLIHLFDAEAERKLGEDIVLDCRAVGVPQPEVMWVGPEGAVVQAGAYHPRRVLRNGNTLVLRHLQFQDAGLYTCLAKSERGEVLSQARLNVSSIQVEIVPLETTETSATVTWRGLDRSANVFQIMFRPVLDESRHRYGGSVSPAMRSYSLHALNPDTEYEICLAFEDGQGILTHISCAFMRTKALHGLELLTSRLQSGSNLGMAAGAGIVALSLLLLCLLVILARRGRGKRFAYDNLAQVELGSPALPSKHLPHLTAPSPRSSTASSTENVYSPLVPGQIV